MPYVVVVDDTDPGIQYNGTWQVLVGSSRQWDSTVHGTTTAGTSLQYTFAGTAIMVYGTISAGTMNTSAQYSVDGSTPVATTQQSQPDAQYEQIFWQSGLLQDVQHTIVITTLDDGGGYYFDRFIYNASDNTPLTTASSSPTSSQGTETKISSSAVMTVTITSAPSSHSSSHVGAIAGGVVGGIAALAVLFVILFFCWRRRRVANNLDGTGSTGSKGMGYWRARQNKTGVPTPFDISEANADSPLPSGSTGQPTMMSQSKRDLRFAALPHVHDPSTIATNTSSGGPSSAAGSNNSNSMLLDTKSSATFQSRFQNSTPTSAGGSPLDHVTSPSSTHFSGQSASHSTAAVIPPSVIDPLDVPPSYQSAREQASTNPVFS